jgi:glutamate-5-semialdehyde dehydrogenase
MLLEEVTKKAVAVKEASRILYSCSTAKKNKLLRALILQLKRHKVEILLANQVDLEAAKRGGLSDVLIDRLTLDDRRIQQMISGIQDVVRLSDPVGAVFGKIKRPNGLVVEKMRVPLGAVGIIYEARPNVTIDASVLCLKSGNAVLLRGGSEAIHTNTKFVEIIKLALCNSQLPEG